MTKFILMFLTLLFCASSLAIGFHPCAKPDGGVMYSNVPCECIQFSDQNRTYSKCAQMGMPTTAQQARVLKRKQEIDVSSAERTEIRRIENEKRRLEDKKRQIEIKKQNVLDEMARSNKNPRSKTFGDLLGDRISLVNTQAELIAINNELATINNELEAKDMELDKYRSAKEVALREAQRAQAQQKRKDALEKLEQDRKDRQEEQRSKQMERKIDGIADKLGVW